MTRTLVTGIAGFTGRYVAARLMEQGHEVHGIVHESPGDPIDGVARLYSADLTDLPGISRVVEDVQPDNVVHLAGIAFVAHSDVGQIYRSNVEGTRQLLQALTGLDRAPGAVVLASSANVYGNAREGELDESTAFAPTNDYAVSKVALEYVASLYRERLPIIVARPFNYTGRGQSAQFLIPKIVAHARDLAPSIQLGNLDIARDFSDVRTVAQVYCDLIRAPQAVGGTYNICSGTAVTLRRVLELVWELSGHRFEVLVDPKLERRNEVRTLRGSKAALEHAIGSISAIPLKDTLRWMLTA